MWGSEDDLFNAQSEAERTGKRSQDRRQLEDSDILGLLSDIIGEVLEEEEAEKRKSNKHSRQGKQLPVIGSGRRQQFQEGCKTSGYETRVREECGTAIETVCETVQVTKTRKEIDQECMTKVR